LFLIDLNPEMGTRTKLNLFKNMSIMSKLTASYLAGLIDGEGCLDFGTQKTESKIYYRPRIRITMVDKKMIEWLQKSFGGGFETRIFKDSNCRTAYTWNLSGYKLKPFLLKICPYLKLKKPQCIVLLKKIKLQEIHKNKMKGNPRCLPSYMDKHVREIEELHQEIRQLNKRGK